MGLFNRFFNSPFVRNVQADRRMPVAEFRKRIMQPRFRSACNCHACSISSKRFSTRQTDATASACPSKRHVGVMPPTRGGEADSAAAADALAAGKPGASAGTRALGTAGALG